MIKKEINIPIFDATVVLFHGEHADVEEAVNKKYVDANFENTSYHYGHYLRIESDERIDMCIMLYDCSTHEHVYHESLHAAYDIIDHIGIGIDVNNHELLAYLMNYIAVELLKVIGGKLDGRR